MTAFARTGTAAVLIFIGVVALAASPPRDGVGPWAVVFMISTSAGFWILASRLPFSWIVAGLPWWVYANASPVAMTAALGLTIGGAAIMAVGPVLPGRRRRHPAPPLAHLAQGPLVPVGARTFTSGQRSRVIDILAALLAAAAVCLFVASAAMDEPATPAALSVAAAIMCLTFLFSNWFATRVRLRVDATGIHTRVMFREQTMPWRDVGAVSLRYVFMGSGLRLVYYCVHSPKREVAFPSSLNGAAELRATIEAATGLSWPAPDITPNF